MKSRSDSVRAIEWKDDRLLLLDQRILPADTCFIEYTYPGAVAQAITDMVVRGAPAIGITAAYGVVLSAMRHCALDTEGFMAAVNQDMEILAAS